jgi:hypothetical protein
MQNSLIKISFLLVLFSCRQPKQKEVYIKTPKLERSINYSEDYFEEPFFKERHFSYKQSIEKDSNGNFNFTYPDGTTNNSFPDTTRHYYTSETIVQIDTT